MNLLTKDDPLKTELCADSEKEEFEVLQLKDNVLPRGPVPSEELFYFNDVAKNAKMEHIRANIEECNIGSE